jgi:hypothetical protein
MAQKPWKCSEDSWLLLRFHVGTSWIWSTSGNDYITTSGNKKFWYGTAFLEMFKYVDTSSGCEIVITLVVEVEVNLRPTLSRPVCLGVRHPSGTCDQIFFLLEISLRQLQVCYFVAPSLMRGRVCNLLGLVRAVTLGSKSRRTQAIFYCPIWDSPNLEGQVPVFISPRNRVAQLYPRALGSLFVASYDSQGCGGGMIH